MVTKTSNLLKNMKQQNAKVTPIGTEIVLPNHSGMGANQDANNFLNNKFVPYTNATANVDLGSKTLTTTGKGTFRGLTISDNIVNEFGQYNGIIYLTGNDGAAMNLGLLLGSSGTSKGLYPWGFGNAKDLGLSAASNKWRDLWLSRTAYVNTLSLSTGSITDSTGAISFGNENLSTTGTLAAATLNTGQGANELYAMDQNVRTSDSPYFTNLNIQDGVITLTDNIGELPLTLSRETGLTFDNDSAKINLGSVATGYGSIVFSGDIGGSPGISLAGETWMAPTTASFADPCAGIWACLKLGTQVQDSLQTTGAAFTLFDDDIHYAGQECSALRIEDAVGEANTYALNSIGKSWLAGNVTIGNGTAGIDYTITFDGETNNGILTYMEDEDELRFDGTFRANAYQSSDGTAGATATTAGAVFKDGLYTSGSITATSPTDYYESVDASGTTYTLTNSWAKVDFGTTDPAIVLDEAGTYLIISTATVYLNGATFAASQSIGLKLRRTNNTAADITSAAQMGLGQTGVLTTLTGTMGGCNIAPIIYTTANTDDAIEMQGYVSATPSAGSVEVKHASIVAIRIA